MKENEKIDKFLEFVREQKKLWNLRVMVILIIVGVPGVVSKGLERRLAELDIWGRINTIQTITLLRLARILRRILKTQGDLVSPKQAGHIFNQTVKPSYYEIDVRIYHHIYTVRLKIWAVGLPI